jgi:hypothetical protein
VPAAKKTTAKKKPAKKKPAKKAAAKKPAKRTPVKRTPVKKAVAKKTTAKKKPAKKAVARKTTTAKRTAAKKAAPRKPAGKSTAASRTPVKKAATAEPVVRKTAAAQRADALAELSNTLDTHTPTLVNRRPSRRALPPEGELGSRGLWLLDVPFDDRNSAKWGGAHWDPKLRKWVFRGERLPASLAAWAAPRYSWERWMQDNTNGVRQPAPQSGKTIVLRGHQELAAEAIHDAWKTGMPGFLLADQVGLGKTYATIAGVNQMGSNLNILVLSPLSVVRHWRRSIEAMGDGGNRWCVQNYDRAKSLLEVPESAKTAVKARTKNKRLAQQGKSLVAWDIVIADEAHRLKNPQSQRSAAVRQIIKGHGTAAFVLWLSATAGQNPLELAYLAPLLAWRTGAQVRGLEDFEQWCRDTGLGVKRGSFGSWEWVRNEEDLHMMRRLLFDGTPTAGLRRRPEDLEGWPEMQRIAWPIELERSKRALYDEAWEEFRAQLALTPADQDSHNALVAALRFRQKASLLRVDETVQHALELLDEGLQVAISVQFIETAEAIVAQLEAAKPRVECARITGSLSAQAREDDRIAFQQGLKPACVFTVTEGISLHAGEMAVDATSNERAMIMHDLRWSALDTAQIEGRCHRDGQNAVAYYVFAEDTVEERVAQAVLGRLADMGAMLGDDTVGLDVLLAAVS